MTKVRDAVGQWVGRGDWVAYVRPHGSDIISTRRKVSEVFDGFALLSDEITFADQPDSKNRRAKAYNCILICDQHGDHE